MNELPHRGQRLDPAWRGLRDHARGAVAPGGDQESSVIGRRRFVEWSLIAASVLALIMSMVSSCQSRSYARCQSAVSEALIAATNARADAAERDRQSDRDESAA